MGLSLTDKLVVRPLDERDRPTDGHALGHYHPRPQEIQILPFDAAVEASRETPPAFGVPMTRPLWRSYIAHELAHAVAERAFASGVPHLPASEYIASVVQLSVLTEETRTPILDNYRNAPAWTSAGEITTVYYFMNPAAFAVKSYRHYNAMPSGERERFVERAIHEGLRE